VGSLPVSVRYLKEPSYRYNSSNATIFASFYIVSLIAKLDGLLKKVNCLNTTLLKLYVIKSSGDSLLNVYYKRSGTLSSAFKIFNVTPPFLGYYGKFRENRGSLRRARE